MYVTCFKLVLCPLSFISSVDSVTILGECNVNYIVNVCDMFEVGALSIILLNGKLS